MEEELVELDSGLAFHDRNDALVVLDRREPRDLHLVREAHEDPALLRLGDELVHRPGACVAVLRHVEPADVPSGANRFEDRVRSGDRLARRRVRGRRRAGPGGDASDRLAVARLLASRALAPSPPRHRPRTAGATAPALRPALSLRFAALVASELAGLFALFARE